MVIGGEFVAEEAGVRRPLRASTEPPMVIGGEPSPARDYFLKERLQRSRRW